MVPPSDFRSLCPVASALDVVGDRWTLVLVRDFALGATRYTDFLASPEGIPTNLLADRLRLLETQGIVRKAPYQARPVRYEYRLTEKGQALLPVMRSLREWGMEWLPNRSDTPPSDLPWTEPSRQRAAR